MERYRNTPNTKEQGEAGDPKRGVGERGPGTRESGRAGEGQRGKRGRGGHARRETGGRGPAQQMRATEGEEGKEGAREIGVLVTSKNKIRIL